MNEWMHNRTTTTVSKKDHCLGSARKIYVPWKSFCNSCNAWHGPKLLFLNSIISRLNCQILRIYSPALPPKQLFRFLRPPHIFRILSCPCAHGMEYYARCGVISAWRAPSTHSGLIHLSQTKEWLDGFLASDVLLLTDWLTNWWWDVDIHGHHDLLFKCELASEC